VERVTKGQPGSKAPHSKGMTGLNDEQAKAIADASRHLSRLKINPNRPA